MTRPPPTRIPSIASRPRRPRRRSPSRTSRPDRVRAGTRAPSRGRVESGQRPRRRPRPRRRTRHRRRRRPAAGAEPRAPRPCSPSRSTSRGAERLTAEGRYDEALLEVSRALKLAGSDEDRVADLHASRPASRACAATSDARSRTTRRSSRGARSIRRRSSGPPSSLCAGASSAAPPAPRAPPRCAHEPGGARRRAGNAGDPLDRPGARPHRGRAVLEAPPALAWGRAGAARAV
jgi:hypothetical protein